MKDYEKDAMNEYVEVVGVEPISDSLMEDVHASVLAFMDYEGLSGKDAYISTLKSFSEIVTNKEHNLKSWVSVQLEYGLIVSIGKEVTGAEIISAEDIVKAKIYMLKGIENAPVKFSKQNIALLYLSNLLRDYFLQKKA